MRKVNSNFYKEDLLGNSESINNLVRKKPSLARRIYQKIKQLLNAIKGTNAEQKTVTRLKITEALFKRALNSMGIEKYVGKVAIAEYKKERAEYLSLDENKRQEWLEKKGYTEDFFVNNIYENNEKIDNDNQVRYNRKTRYISYDKVGEDNIRSIRQNLYKLYEGVDDAIADNLAVEVGDTVYVVDSGKDEGKISFGVREKLTISSSELRKEFVERQNENAIRKGYIDNGLSSRLGIEHVDDRTRNRGQEPRKELSTNQGKSTNNQERVSNEDGNRRSGRLRFSNKDSNGNTLSVQQQEFFRDSKVRDENGNLLVVYHGTNAEFTVFKHSENASLGKGIYFAESEEYAKNHNRASKVVSVYLNITNPYVANYPGGIEQKELVEKGYDGVYNPSNKFWVAFNSNQIKEVTNKAPTKSDDIRFSRKESFAEQVDNVLTWKDNINTHLLVAEHTPKLLQDLGLSDNPILITAVHTKTAVGVTVKNKNVHNLKVETFKDLPSLIEKPAIVMDSARAESNSIVMFVNAKDIDGNPVICTIKADGYGYYNNIEIDSNVITSVYGKDANPTGFIRKAVIENRVLYWDKKISQELFNIPGLQLPDNIKHLDSNIIIRKTNAKVNPSTENSSIRESRKPTYTLSDGQVKKKLADFTRLKVYSKVELEQLANTILSTVFENDNAFVKLSGKNKAEVIDALWKGFNTLEPGKRTGLALKTADYIIDNAIMQKINISRYLLTVKIIRFLQSF